MLTAWRLEYTSGVPCDSFWLRCPWEGGSGTSPADWVTFSAHREGERVFTGVVDECQVSLSASPRQSLGLSQHSLNLAESSSLGEWCHSACSWPSGL